MILLKKDIRDRDRGRPAHHANIIVCDGDSLRRQTMPEKMGKSAASIVCVGVFRPEQKQKTVNQVSQGTADSGLNS
jgi:hypothetical protein